MLLQLQFIANGIIGLLSQSITSLLKLISMIIHWNHQENTLSWWVFPPDALEENEPTLIREPVMSNTVRVLLPACSGEQCLVIPLTILKDTASLPGNRKLDFIFIHNSQELEMQIEVETQEKWKSGLSRAWIWGWFQFICSLDKYWFCLLYLTLGKQLSPSVPLFPCQ